MRNVVFILGLMAVIAISSTAKADCCNADCSCQWTQQGTSVTIKAIGNNVVMDDYNEIGPWGKDVTNVTIEGNFETLGAYAFKNATALESVDIKGSIKNINKWAFHNTALTYIELPDGLETMGREVFSSCSQLEHVTIPDTVTTIGAWAFQNAALTEVEIPNGVKNIGSGAFHNCTSLEKLTIPDSVETFSYDDYTGYGDYGHATFADGNLKELIISSDKIEMYKNAGGDISNLTMIYCTDSVDKCQSVLDTLGVSVPMVDKALSDMASSGEYCDSLESCKALSDMASSGEYCDSLESCKALSDMAASGEYCTTIAECKRFTDLMNSGYCDGFEACKEMFNANVINYDGKRYGSLDDLYNGNALPSITQQEQGDGSFAVYKDGAFVGYKGKRIYTMEEANRVTKPTGNTFKIKYR